MSFESRSKSPDEKISADWDQDDFARLLALEHAFCAVTLLSASNFANLSGTSPTAAVKQIRDAIEGSILDTGQTSRDIKASQQRHLKRIFDHIAQMARQVEKGM